MHYGHTCKMYVLVQYKKEKRKGVWDIVWKEFINAEVEPCLTLVIVVHKMCVCAWVL